ncbi:MAG: hypothetical protein WDO74_04605 [Pseudomonadota bacterium]
MTLGRFVLVLDILGFKEMLRAQSAEQVCLVVEDVLAECDNWTEFEHNDFDTIHFSDTILLHARNEGTYREWYDDLVFIGSRICNRLLAQGIPVRGAMGFGPFVTKKLGRHLVFLGQALVDAYTAQEEQPFLGFSVPPQIWLGMYPKPGAENHLTKGGKGVLLPDGSFWINPLTEFIDNDKDRVAYKIEHDFDYPNESGSGYLDGELRAFEFIDSEAERLARIENVPKRLLAKYVNTLTHLRTTLGDALFSLACKLASDLPDAVESTPGRK